MKEVWFQHSTGIDRLKGLSKELEVRRESGRFFYNNSFFNLEIIEIIAMGR